MAGAEATDKSKPGAEPQVGTSRAELKTLLRLAKKDAINVAIALDSNNKAIILADKRREGRTLIRELKGSGADTKNHRFGELTIDAKDQKLARFSLDKAASGMARRVIIALKGTGFSKVEITSKDGAEPERHEEPDEQAEADEHDNGAGHGPKDGAKAGAAKQVDTGKMVAELTPLVREALELGAKNPPLKAELQKLCTAAQTSLRKVMLSLDAKEAERVQDDIDALHNAVEDAREGGGAGAAGGTTGKQPSAQAVADKLTDVAKHAPAAIKAAPHQAAQIKAHINGAHAALKSGNVQQAEKLVAELAGLMTGMGPSATAQGMGALAGSQAAAATKPNLVRPGSGGQLGQAGGAAAAAGAKKPEPNPHAALLQRAGEEWDARVKEAHKEAESLVHHVRKTLEPHTHGKQLAADFEKLLWAGVGTFVPGAGLARQFYELGRAHKDQLPKGLQRAHAVLKEHVKHLADHPILREVEATPGHPVRLHSRFAEGLRFAGSILQKVEGVGK